MKHTVEQEYNTFLEHLGYADTPELKIAFYAAWTQQLHLLSNIKSEKNFIRIVTDQADELANFWRSKNLEFFLDNNMN